MHMLYDSDSFAVVHILANATDPAKGAGMVGYAGGTVADKLSEIVSGAVTAPQVASAIAGHDSDVGAHPALSAFITSEADRAEAAADAASDEYNGVQESINAITADPANAVTAIWIPSQAFELMQGGATLSKAVSRLPCWLMPSGPTPSYLASAIQLPSHWATMRCVFYVANTAANSGGPRLSCEVHNWAVGDSINTSPSGSSVFAAIPSTAWVTATLSTGSIAVDPSKTTTVRLGRTSNSANDTLPNDLALLGVRLEKLS